MWSARGNAYQFSAHGEAKYGNWATNSGRAGRKGRQKGRTQSEDYLINNPRGGMRAISNAMARGLRHEHHSDRQRGGFMPLTSLLEAPVVIELFATQSDIRQIVRGDGGNHKLRFETWSTQDQTTATIRAPHGHSASVGVADDVLPLAGDLVTIAHGTTSADAQSIVHDGISRAGRLRIHFYEIDLGGRPTPCVPPVRQTSEVIIAASAEKCERYGLVFYKASDGVISTPGLGGFVPASCILCVRQLPS